MIEKVKNLELLRDVELFQILATGINNQENHEQIFSILKKRGWGKKEILFLLNNQ